MPKGWQISFVDHGMIRIFIVGIADQDQALAAVTNGRAKADGIVCVPLNDGDFEKLALLEGQIIESAQIG
jgi:hypothetical protein